MQEGKEPEKKEKKPTKATAKGKNTKKVSKAVDPNDENRLVVLKHSTRYFKDFKKVQWTIILFQIAVVCCLGLLLIVQLLNRPPTVRFFENAKGQIITPKPLNQPAMSNAAINNWMIEGLMSGLHFNFTTIDRAMESLYDYFDDDALESFKKALVDMGIVSIVVNQKMICTGKALGAPEVLNEGVINGIYSWHLKVPLEISLSNELVSRGFKVDVEVLVVRVPELVSPMGILISKFSSKQIGTSTIDVEGASSIKGLFN